MITDTARELASEMLAPERSATDVANDIGEQLDALNAVHSSLDLLVSNAPISKWHTALAHHVDALGGVSSKLHRATSQLRTSLYKAAQLGSNGADSLSEEAADPLYDVSYGLSELESLMEELVEPAKEAGWSEIMSHLTKSLRRIRLDLGIKIEAITDCSQASGS